MGLQLIFCVETNKSCKSDWIYLKDTIEFFYHYDRTFFKFTPVYMDGKGNYRTPKIQKELSSLTHQYQAGSKQNRSVILYCFDCDHYDKKKEDALFLTDAKSYCASSGSEFVWFCRDIESVYLGKSIPTSQKRKAADTFKAAKKVKLLHPEQFQISTYHLNSSNLFQILDKYLSRK